MFCTVIDSKRLHIQLVGVGLHQSIHHTPHLISNVIWKAAPGDFGTSRVFDGRHLPSLTLSKEIEIFRVVLSCAER